MKFSLLAAVAPSLLIGSCVTVDRNNVPSVGSLQSNSIAVPPASDAISSGKADSGKAGLRTEPTKLQNNVRSSTNATYSFFDVIQSALNSDVEYAIARENRQSARLDLTIVKREYLPDIKAKYDIEQIKYSDADTRDSRLSEASITIEQPLFDATIISNRRVAQQELLQAEAELLAERDLLLNKVILAYIGALRTQAAVAFRRQDLRAIEEQIKESRTLQQLGVLTTIDVSEIEAQLNLAVGTLLEAENRASIAKETLFEFTDLDSNQPIATLKKHLVVGNLKPTIVENWVSAGLKNNTQIKASELNISVLKASEKVPYAKHIPSLAIEGGITKPFEAPDDITDANLNIGLNLTMSLFDRGRTKANIAKQRNATRIAEYQAQLTRRRLTKEIRNSFQLSLSSIARIKANTRAVEAFTDAEQSIESGFNLGVRTALDLLNARRSKLQSENLLTNAYLDYFQSSLLLRLNVNMLSINELRKFDQFFNKAASND